MCKELGFEIPHGGPGLQSNGGENYEHQTLNTWPNEDCTPTRPWLLEDLHLLQPKPNAPQMPNNQKNSRQRLEISWLSKIFKPPIKEKGIKKK